MKVFLSLLLLVASAYCAPTTTVEPSASTPSRHAPEDWEHFHRQVQVQVFQLAASVHELHQKVNQHTFDDVQVLVQVVARDRVTAKTIMKEVENESKRFFLDKNQQIFITETITTLDHLEKQLTKLHDTLAETVHKASTPAFFEAETVATTAKIVAATTKIVTTTAKIVATTKSGSQDFLKFYELISGELKKLESSINHVEHEEKQPHLFGIGLKKLKDQVNTDLHQILILEKQIEVELTKTLNEEEKALVIKSADSLKLLKKRADDLHNKLDKKHPITETPVTGKPTEEAKKTTVAATTTTTKKPTVATTKISFEAETVATTISPFEPFEWIKFHDKVKEMVNSLETRVLLLSHDFLAHPQKRQLLVPQIENELKAVAEVEKFIQTTESLKSFNQKEKLFVKQMLAVVETNKKHLLELEAHKEVTTPKPNTTSKPVSTPKQ